MRFSSGSGTTLMVGRVLLMYFMMKCAMWTTVVSRDRLNYVRSIPSQSAVWVRSQSPQCWSSWRLDILYAIEWAILEWTVAPCIDMIDIPYGSKNPIAIVFFSLTILVTTPWYVLLVNPVLHWEMLVVLMLTPVSCYSGARKCVPETCRSPLTDRNQTDMM